MKDEPLPSWAPIQAITPAKWHKFFGRQMGRTTIGIAAAFNPTALYFGAELLVGPARGISIVIGPVWVGVVMLRSRASMEQSQ